MLPELIPFEYYYSTYQRIAQSFYKTSTRHYTNLNICTKYLRLTYQTVYNQLKVTRTCSRSPLSCPLWGRSLSDIDQIGHRCNRPLHPPQAHPAEYVANRTSPTRVHDLHTVGGLETYLSKLSGTLRSLPANMSILSSFPSGISTSPATS